MPNVAGEASTKRQILIYALAVAPVGVIPAVLGTGGLAYAIVSTLLGAGFVYYAFRVYRMDSSDRVMKPAKALFKFSLFYLSGLFATLLAENLAARAVGLWGQ